MNENLEIVTHIYKDSEMSISSLKKLNTVLENKDNKIKNIIEEILQGYGRVFNFNGSSRNIYDAMNGVDISV